MPTPSRAPSTASHGQAIDDIERAFGPGFINAERALDRERMREAIFRDSGLREALEHIVHPIVQREMLRQAAHAQAEGARCALYDIPLLVESGRWRAHLDRVLVVDCPRELQVQRVRATLWPD